MEKLFLADDCFLLSDDNLIHPKMLDKILATHHKCVRRSIRPLRQAMEEIL